MASKIFMGKMPELMENILNNLNNETGSLHSCALVNRHWCRISTPILWQNPFSYGQKPLFISNYFLPKDEKFFLKECGIKAEFSETLFDYSRFLKVLDLPCLGSKVKEWINSNDSLSLNRIINLLLKLFIESGATLYKLDLYFSFEIDLEIFHALEKNEQFFSHLQYLFLDLSYPINTENATVLLKTLAKNATKISVLRLGGFYSDHDPQIFHILINIIKSQEQLRQFSLVGEDYPTDFHGTISALENQKNSLQEFLIDSCEWNEEFDVLKNCNKLEILRIWYFDYRELLKTLNNKISTLEVINGSIDSSAITQILENSGTALQRLKLISLDYEIWEESLLLETLKSYCPNITYLNISCIEFSTQLLELIDNLQKLQFLALWCTPFIPEDEIKIRVMQFAEILPVTLQYLELRDTWLTSYIYILLKHCISPLQNLLIYRLYGEKNIKALIEFCKRNKSLNYVGIDKDLDLEQNIRKEVEAYVALVPHEDIAVDC